MPLGRPCTLEYACNVGLDLLIPKCSDKCRRIPQSPSKAHGENYQEY